MVGLGGLKKTGCHPVAAARLELQREDRSVVHARDSLAEEMSMVLRLWGSLMLLDPTALLPC